MKPIRIYETLDFEKGKGPGVGIKSHGIEIQSLTRWSNKHGEVTLWDPQTFEYLQWPNKGNRSTTTNVVLPDGREMRLDSLIRMNKPIIYKGHVFIPNQSGGYESPIKMNESLDFERDKDPKQSIGIGMMNKIKKWAKEESDAIEDINDKDQLLIFSAEHGKIDFVKYLLDIGADIHAKNDDALRWASSKGHTKVVKLLLDAGANVHAEDNVAFTLGKLSRPHRSC